MELTHQFTVPATPDETWTAFNDIASIASCFPGATLLASDGDEFQGAVKIKLGPISMQYAGTARFVERDEDAARLVIKAHGKDKRGQGTADATVTARLTGLDEGTRVDVTTDLAITGKPAQFGRGMIQDVSERLLSRFVDALSRQLSGQDDAVDRDAGPAGSGAGPEGPAAGPSGAPTGSASTAPAAGGGGAADSGELDLAATVLPVLARRYGALVLTAVVFLLLGRVLGRRR